VSRLLLLDNYDSFTWNLAQYLQELGAELRVELTDGISVKQVLAERFDAVVLSPGPGLPCGAGIMLDLIRALPGRLPLLGVCLGHQAIAEAYGGRVVPAPALVHGKTSRIFHSGEGIFDGLPDAFDATRYHSWVVDEVSLPAELRVVARTGDGVVMALEHRSRPVWGVQFHPESVLTGSGKRLLGNFLDRVEALAPCPV